MTTVDPALPGAELFEAIRELKDRLQVNVELVSPPDYIPELPGWRERSPLLFRRVPWEGRTGHGLTLRARP